ncbi:MAG: hypothetical protein JO355_00495 [Planctomycetaceae bacterium]|nr:hypothetical protein [Planctomycetaceae bacterium]
MEQHLGVRQPAFLERRQPSGDHGTVALAGDLLHRDQADAELVAGVERPVRRGVSVETEGVLDLAEEVPLGGGLESSAWRASEHEKPTKRALPDLLSASTAAFHSRPLGHSSDSSPW